MSINISGDARPCVLVVVADPLSRELLQQTLHVAGFNAVTASSGEQGLLHLRESRRSVEWLVTSLNLPGLVDGFILADEFQALHPSRGPLFLTQDSATAASEIIAQLRALTEKAATAPEPSQAETGAALAA